MSIVTILREGVLYDDAIEFAYAGLCGRDNEHGLEPVVRPKWISGNQPGPV